ncbi:MAG: hypothetical protein AAF513_11880 [Pseudomonadota bacterium]
MDVKLVYIARRILWDLNNYKRLRVKRWVRAAFLSPNVGIAAITLAITLSVYTWEEYYLTRIPVGNGTSILALLGTFVLVRAFVINEWFYRNQDQIFIVLYLVAMLFSGYWWRTAEPVSWYPGLILFLLLLVLAAVNKRRDDAQLTEERAKLRLAITVISAISGALLMLVTQFVAEEYLPGNPETIHAYLKLLLFVEFCAAITLIIWALAGSIALRNISHENYADIVAGHDNLEESIRACSELIESVCERYLRGVAIYRIQTHELYRIAMKPEDEDSEPYVRIQTHYADRKTKKLYEKAYYKYQDRLFKLINQTARDLDRLTFVKLLVATRLQTDNRELCDQFFRFSPSVFRQRLSKNATNLMHLQEELNTVASGTSQLADECVLYLALVKQVENLALYVEQASRRQHEIARLPNEVSFATHLVTEASSSGAVQIYAKALQQYTYRKREFQFGSALLFDAQKIHPTANPHRRLYKLCAAESDLGEIRELLDGIEQNARIDRQARETSLAPLCKVLLEIAKRIWKRLRRAPEVASFSPPAGLEHLLNKVNSHIHKERVATQDSFRDVYNTWFQERKASQYKFVLTLDYSRMVRNCLKYSISNWEHASGPTLLLVDGGSERRQLARRVFRHELVYDGNMPHDRIRAVPRDSIGRIMEILPDNSDLLVLMGTESFTKDGQFLFPGDAQSSVAQFTTPKSGAASEADAVDKALSRSPVLVLVAESYKADDELLLTNSGKLDSPKVLTGMVDILVSGSAVIPFSEGSTE